MVFLVTSLPFNFFPFIFSPCPPIDVTQLPLVAALPPANRRRRCRRLLLVAISLVISLSLSHSLLPSPWAGEARLGLASIEP